jgi:hypothetical protein
MAPTEDRSLDNLIRASENLILDLATLGDSRALPDVVERELDQQVAVPLESFTEPSTDGLIEIKVSPDEMVVYADFQPPTGEGKPLLLEQVQSALEGANITLGVDWEGIKGCLLTCNEERTEIRDMVIARGKKPIDEIPPSLALSDRLVSTEKEEKAIGARVNFKELSLFTLVKKGEELAVLVPKQNGAMGVTVRGNAVAFGKQRVPFPRPGKNTNWAQGRVVAQCDGRFQVTRDSFWVDEILNILGDIDLKVGNIDFPGDLVVRGEIRDGFVVKAGKSILCTGCIGAARIECGGDLVTLQGVVGKEKAVIRVAGAVEAKFLESCALDADGPVRIRTSILNSTIHTRDMVETGDQGIIIGGIVKAQNGVSAAQIGTERGPRTEIHCGIDFKVEQKLVWIRDRNISLAFKLREIESKMKSSAKARDVLAPLRERIKAAIHQLNENARALVSGLDRNEKAVVSVRGTVYPGTYIEICHVSHFITRPRRFLSFKLDRKKGKIIETKWEKADPPTASGKRPPRSSA